MNPADIVSRGATVIELITMKWADGPLCLGDKDNWPSKDLFDIKTIEKKAEAEVKHRKKDAKTVSSHQVQIVEETPGLNKIIRMEDLMNCCWLLQWSKDSL